MNLRQMRGKEIVKILGKYIKKTENGWLVPSQTSRDMYQVDEFFTCSCPDSQKRGVTCKHGYAVRFYLQAENPQGRVVHKQRLTHKQAWHAYNEGQRNEIRLFDELLKDLVSGVDEPVQTMGRPTIPLKEQLFVSVQKVYSQLSSRRAETLFGRAAERGQIGHKPHYNTVSKLLNREDVTLVLHKLIALSAAPLKTVETDFCVDGTGFRTTSFGQYAEEKYELNRDHKWLKAHACVGVKTNIVTSVEITESQGEGAGESPRFPVLVQRTANNGFTIKEVSADKAYSSADNYNIVQELGGQAYIPFKDNANASTKGGRFRLFRKMFHYFQLHQDEFFEHYHKRSNVESTFAALKKKFGDTLKSKNTTAQVNELLCKILAYNLTVVIHEMHELNIEADFQTNANI